MRWPLLFLLFPALAFAAIPATFETRSQDHAMVVDVIPVGVNGDVTYAVRVTDLHTGELLASPRIVVRGSAGESVSEVRDLKIRILLHPSPSSLSASVEIQKGDTVVDSMQSRWATKPTRPSRMVTSNTPGGNGPLRVGGDVKAPVIVNRVEPIYTDEALRARISGIVIVEAMIDKNGDVRDATVLKPLPFGLDQAALDAFRRWKFRPGTLNGRPVDVLFNVTINFKLDAPKPAAPPAQ
jgi:TonB family protein